MQLSKPENHPFLFDPTYGYDLPALQAMQPPETEPADFAAFWQKLHAEAMQVPLRLEKKPTPTLAPGYTVWNVYYDVLDSTRVGGWLVVPDKLDELRCVVICGHGYGGREAIEPSHLGGDRILFYPLAPGFHLSAAPERFPVNDAGKHVVFGLESRETYILRLCAATIWRAIDVVQELYPDTRKLPYHYLGWSFGGGMGALMLPWEKRFVSAELGQPTFGNHPFRLANRCVGSGEAVRQLYLTNPEIEPVLRYFDAATSARHMTQPVVFALSCFDPAVPPPGQFSIANAHPGKKRISLFSTGHYAYVAPGAVLEDRAHLINLLELIGPVATPRRLPV